MLHVEYVLGAYSEGTPGIARGLECAAAAARPRGRAVAVPSCAGAYVSGAAGSNACPAGSARIETEAACRTAVAAAGKTFYAVVTYAAYPRGCYYNTGYDNGDDVYTFGNNAYFNAHAVGADSYSWYRLLCAALATTGAPLTRRCAKRVCCAVLAGGGSNNTNGLNIDTHAYIRMYICARMVPTALAVGGQCSAVLCTLGVWQYISDTHGVLKGYSQVRGTHSRGTPRAPALRGALPGGGGAQRCAARVQRQEGYSRGTPRVLIGYSHGTHGVLPGC
jgi:hypothetical protein